MDSLLDSAVHQYICIWLCIVQDIIIIFVCRAPTAGGDEKKKRDDKKEKKDTQRRKVVKTREDVEEEEDEEGWEKVPGGPGGQKVRQSIVRSRLVSYQVVLLTRR